MQLGSIDDKKVSTAHSGYRASRRRRVALRASAKLLIGSLALGMFASEASAAAGSRTALANWTAPLTYLVQTNGGGAFGNTSSAARRDAESWLTNAKKVIAEGNIEQADYFIRKGEEAASKMAPTDPPLAYSPAQARQELQARLQRAAQTIPQQQLGGPVALGAPMPSNNISRPVYNPATDASRNMPASNNQGAFRASFAQETESPAQLIEAGRQAMAANDANRAREFFSRAWQMQNQLSPQDRQFLQEQLNTLSPPAGEPIPGAGLDEQQALLRQKLTNEVFRERQIAAAMVEQQNPRGALQHLQGLRERVSQAQIDAAVQRQLLSVVDREIADMERFIQQNSAEIENNETNAQRIQEVYDRRAQSVEVENKIAKLVDEFNKLMDENRFAEAEVIARQANELAPEMPVVVNMKWKVKFASRIAEQMSIRDQKESGFVGALTSVDEASIPFDDRNPIQYGTDWADLSEKRARMSKRGLIRTPEEQRILGVLKTHQVEMKFSEMPLSEVLNLLQAQTQVNIFVDKRALMSEAVATDTPITMSLDKPITFASGLNLLLEPLGLTFEVRDDVIRVTTPEMKNRNVYQETYYVGDLVKPIPDFLPTYNMGLAGALSNAYQNLTGGYGVGGQLGMPLAQNGNAASVANYALGQQLPGGVVPGSGAMPGMGGQGAWPGMTGSGAAGMGGGVQADFDSLIELIQDTINPESWQDTGGGAGRIQRFEQNLSLVIYQTQEVHEQIQDLLDQLRRIQDLQITIEVRFLTLQDDFFERIGVDFDVEFRDKSQAGVNANGQPNLPNSGVVGLQPVTGGTRAFTPDLDIGLSQNGFQSAVPQFGGFDVNTATNFGFAILSDIEVFMLLQAAKGDTRTNILQAPKVTLFNGQTSSVSDFASRPFVTGIIPVVGDFAAAQMPVVVVLNEGTQLSVNAVASDDRKHVRLTLVPYFSQIGDVETFTYEGSVTTTTGTNVVDPTNPTRTIQNNATTTTAGSTVQLPVLAITSVNTTVSVPDGGTVLLGGIKRLQEGRNERGVPLLSSLPFINRLFKNVGIGRTTQSLMMMVTPRIIIQEEEEANATGTSVN